MLVQVTMSGNVAVDGGAAALEGKTVTVLTGDNKVHDTTAARGGGGFYADGSLMVDRNLCATNNQAAGYGGFVVGSGLLVLSDSNARLWNNRPDTVSGQAQCGEALWPFNDYTVNGDVCACNAKFTQGLSSTCDQCSGSAGWGSEPCACVSTMHMWLLRSCTDQSVKPEQLCHWWDC